MLVATFLLAYLLGSIPFGLVITRGLGLGDLRAIGSGNIGATNVLRTGNKGAAAATLVLDAGKGAVAVLLARHFAGETAAMVAGFAAFLGHLFPVWLRFKGGKGVATYLGIMLALAWPVGLAACGTWLATALVLGGNIRTGLEDHLYLPNGEMAQSNGEMVEVAVRLCRDIGRRPATVDEARKILSLGPG